MPGTNEYQVFCFSHIFIYKHTIMNFNKLKTTRLGTIGEFYIPEFCKANSVKCYQPSTDGSYPVDSIGLNNKYEPFAIEVKTKARMIYYDETGMDSNDHIIYMKMPFPVYVLFVDSLSKSIYGQWISKLDKCKRIDGRITYYPLEVMEHYRDLSEAEVIELKSLSNSNY